MPLSPFVQPVFWKNTASTAIAAPSVTTARLSPRTRSAGSPRATPIGATIRAAAMIESGNGTW